MYPGIDEVLPLICYRKVAILYLHNKRCLLDMIKGNINFIDGRVGLSRRDKTDCLKDKTWAV